LTKSNFSRIFDRAVTVLSNTGRKCWTQTSSEENKENRMQHRLTGQSVSADVLPREFDLLHHGYTMAGWDFTRTEVAAAISDHRMLNPAFELGTNACPWNCDFCFTEDPANPDGAKRRLQEEMSIAERLDLIRQAAALGARSINFVGAGEPTIDPNFWQILGCMRECGITPIVYTEAALRLTDAGFVKQLYEGTLKQKSQGIYW
jgi:uncharacterized radical SAM superfamily Fe-S cluster-containing enzyme